KWKPLAFRIDVTRLPGMSCPPRRCWLGGRLPRAPAGEARPTRVGRTGFVEPGLSRPIVSEPMTEAFRPRAKYVIGPDGSPLTIAELPPTTTKRWVIRRKAEVVAAVRGGL